MSKITYMVTNYNNSKYLRECLDSVLYQTDSNWECLVIDDCSTDDSWDVLETYRQSKIKVIKNASNIGQVKSLIKLIREADTDIVGILDSDDSLHKDATGEILKAYASSNRIGLVYSNCTQYDVNMSKVVSMKSGDTVPHGKLSSIIFGYISHLRTFRVSCYKKTAGYDTTLICAEDSDLMYKLEEVCLAYHVNKFLYNRRNVPDSRSKNIDNWLEGINNHKIAKLNALKRRKIVGIVRLLSLIYIYADYYRLLNKKRKSKNVFIFRWVTKSVKIFLSRALFKPIIK